MAIHNAIVGIATLTVGLASLGLSGEVVLGSPSTDAGHEALKLLQVSTCSHDVGTVRDLGADYAASLQQNWRLPPATLPYNESQPGLSFTTGDCIVLNSTQTPYCVYFSTDFANGRGISLVGTENLAAHYLNRSAFSDPQVHQHTNTFDSPPYEWKTLPGKGRGLIANRSIRAGTFLMSTTPLLAVESVDEGPYDPQILALQQKAVARLPPQSQQLFYDLAVHQEDIDRVNGAINTNSFMLSLEFIDGNNWATRGVFPEAARMNHDCRPNTHYYVEPATLTQHVQATRDIHPGEEITDSYIGILEAFEDRQDQLQNGWGFRCTCPACAAPQPLREASDARIAFIHAVREKLDSTERAYHADPDMAELLLSLLVQERAEMNYCEGYWHLAMQHSALGHISAATKYAHLTIEVGAMFHDSCADLVSEMWEFVERGPMNHWSWRLSASNHEAQVGMKKEMKKESVVGEMCLKQPSGPFEVLER
ncbi:MAG: hypothetical protein LQ340_007361 [Diploschistes diacapsis]|nr:MAG: hypothetical protein LQ340_007361 [Diploschistes diacapsis]